MYSDYVNTDVVFAVNDTYGYHETNFNVEFAIYNLESGVVLENADDYFSFWAEVWSHNAANDLGEEWNLITTIHIHKCNQTDRKAYFAGIDMRG